MVLIIIQRYASGFGNLIHLGNVNISPADTPILCGIIAAVVQFFFAYRIYTLRRSYWWICVLIVLVRAIFDPRFMTTYLTITVYVFNAPFYRCADINSSDCRSRWHWVQSEMRSILKCLN